MLFDFVDFHIRRRIRDSTWYRRGGGDTRNRADAVERKFTRESIPIQYWYKPNSIKPRMNAFWPAPSGDFDNCSYWLTFLTSPHNNHSA
jgi:hypothetical protein